MNVGKLNNGCLKKLRWLWASHYDWSFRNGFSPLSVRIDCFGRDGCRSIYPSFMRQIVVLSVACLLVSILWVFFERAVGLKRQSGTYLVSYRVFRLRERFLRTPLTMYLSVLREGVYGIGLELMQTYTTCRPQRNFWMCVCPPPCLRHAPAHPSYEMSVFHICLCS